MITSVCCIWKQPKGAKLLGMDSPCQNHLPEALSGSRHPLFHTSEGVTKQKKKKLLPNTINCWADFNPREEIL
jgi:hypothetical protein